MTLARVCGKEDCLMSSAITRVVPWRTAQKMAFGKNGSSTGPSSLPYVALALTAWGYNKVPLVLTMCEMVGWPRA